MPGLLILCFFMQLFIVQGLAGDTLHFEEISINYTTKEGLPSSTVHEVFQSSDGFIWFCTAKGISRFDGQNFINLDEEDGLCSNAVIDVFEDEQKRLWFWTSLNEIFTVDLDSLKVKCMPFNDTLSGFIGASLINELTAKSDTICFFTNTASNGCIYYEHGNGRHQIINLNVPSQENKKIFMYRQTGAKAGVIEYDQAYTANKQITLATSVKFGSCMTPVGPIMVIGNTLMHYDTLKGLPSAARSLSSYCTGDVYFFQGKIWVGTFSHGIFSFLPDENLTPSGHLLNGYTVTGAIVDSEGGRWFSTLNHGVFYYSGPAISSILSNIAIPAIDAVGNQLSAAISFSDGSILSFFPSTPGFLIEKAKLPFPVHLQDFESPTSSKLLLNHQGGMAIDMATSARTYDGVVNPFFFKDSTGRKIFIKTNRNNLMLVSGDSIYRDTVSKEWKHGHLKNVLDFDKGTVFFGCSYGLGILNKKSMKVSEIDLQTKSNTSISQLLKIDNELLLAISEGAGAFLINGTTVVSKLDQHNGLPSDRCISAVRGKHNSFWLGTDMGLVEIFYTKSTMKVGQILSAATGYSISNVTCLAKADNWLLLGTDLALYRINTDLLDNQTNDPEPRLLSVQSYEENIKAINEVYHISPNQKSVTLKFSTPSFRNAFHHKYRYRIEELGDQWTEMPLPQLTLSGLSPGNYHVWVEKFSLNGQWSKKPLLARLQVNPPFYQSLWFILLIGSICISVAGYIFYMRLRYYRKESALQIGLVKTRNQTLSSQLNPHFLYNVLNTVGGSIVREDKQDAVQTISKFSKLMRMVFDNSQHDLVPLEVELQAVKAYVDLESKRLNNSFQFILHIDKNQIDLNELMLPPLLLQPLIENAIWHGISEMEGKGAVELQVRQQQSMVHITVRDNGKGLTHEDLEKSRTSSLKIIINRMELLSKIYGRHVSWQLQSHPKNGWKTELELIFPVIENSMEQTYHQS